jgi:hypothetical protein
MSIPTESTLGVYVYVSHICCMSITFNNVSREIERFNELYTNRHLFGGSSIVVDTIGAGSMHMSSSGSYLAIIA